MSRPRITPPVSTCDLCGTQLAGPVHAVEHYLATGRHRSECQIRRDAIADGVVVVVDLADARHRRRRAAAARQPSNRRRS